MRLVFTPGVGAPVKRRDFRQPILVSLDLIVDQVPHDQAVVEGVGFANTLVCPCAVGVVGSREQDEPDAGIALLFKLGL